MPTLASPFGRFGRELLREQSSAQEAWPTFLNGILLAMSCCTQKTTFSAALRFDDAEFDTAW